MSNFRYMIFAAVIIAWQATDLLAQGFSVKRISVDSQMSNEFSPVFYGEGIVFCSDINTNSLINYRDDNSRVFKIVYSAIKDSIRWQLPGLFSKELTTDFNDGPVTFNKSGDIIYFTRNNNIGFNMKNISDTTNKLGLYSASLKNGKWRDISPFRYNDPEHTFCTPALSPDGRRLYFSTNMPGGFGGMDLYYCDSLRDGWDKPVNMGPLVNTSGNESFPFASGDGNLYFSSDGLNGAGGKDIFYTREVNGNWMEPVRLDSAINSAADDFGIAMDSSLDKGYFSSNRRKSDDIFFFRSIPAEFSSCDSLKEENFCFTFYDERFKATDNLPVTYLWDFGDSMKITGPEVRHCFPGPGEYTVKLTIRDNVSGLQMAPPAIYRFQLKHPDQLLINSWDIGMTGCTMTFSGSTESLIDFNPGTFMWDFGSGFHNGGESVTHSFSKSGEYTVRLGLTGGKDSLGRTMKTCVMKSVRIFDSICRLDNPASDKQDFICKNAAGSSGMLVKLFTGYYVAGNITETEKDEIRLKLSPVLDHGICLEMNGPVNSQEPGLVLLCNILKQYNNLSLNISVRNSKGVRTEGRIDYAVRIARELDIFFRNNHIGKDRYSCRHLDSASSPFGDGALKGEIPDAYVDFCIIKNN